MNAKQLQILQHSLGVDQYGQGSRYRNHYAIGPECSDFAELKALEALGFMQDRGLWGGMHYFTVTPAGVLAMMEASPKPPKLTRSQKRYREFLHSSGGMTFGEWLKERQRYQHDAALLGITQS